MVGEGTPAIFVTFLLAIIGYVGLTTVVVLGLRGTVPVPLWRLVATVIVVHVFMVWTFRYGWSFDLAVRNGYAGFVVFHLALLLILLSTVVREPLSRRLGRVAFLMVSAGALGAAFRYDVVAMYRIPVIACAAAGIMSLARSFIVRQAQTGA